MSTHAMHHRRDGEVLYLRGHKWKESMAAKIQGFWRYRKARNFLLSVIKSVYRKRMDPVSGHYFYLNTRTKDVKWTKPVNLKKSDLEVKEGWERIVSCLLEFSRHQYFLYQLTLI